MGQTAKCVYVQFGKSFEKLIFWQQALENNLDYDKEKNIFIFTYQFAMGSVSSDLMANRDEVKAYISHGKTSDGRCDWLKLCPSVSVLFFDGRAISEILVTMSWWYVNPWWRETATFAMTVLGFKNKEEATETEKIERTAVGEVQLK